jgi:tripartite-type tricarboxylate transporter receptor subunit TctC
MKPGLTLAALVLSVACSSPAVDRFPSRPIELVIAFPPGGVTDMAARLFADDLSRTLKVPVVPTNRGGGSGVVGATVVKQARKDGYTLLVNSVSGMVLGPAVMKDVPYVADRDFVPIAAILVAPNSIIVGESSPFRTLDDLVAAARQRPGALSYGTAGAGTDGHFNAEVFLSSTSLKVKHVPFTGAGELVSALMGGHVDFGAGSLTSYFPLIEGGKIRVLGVTGSARLKTLPDVPTLTELGVTGDFVDSWAAVFAAAGTPEPVVDTLTEAASRFLRSPEFAAKIEKIGGSVPSGSPSEFLSLLRSQQKTAAAVASRLGLLKTGG